MQLQFDFSKVVLYLLMNFGFSQLIHYHYFELNEFVVPFELKLFLLFLNHKFFFQNDLLLQSYHLQLVHQLVLLFLLQLFVIQVMLHFLILLISFHQQLYIKIIL